MHLQTLDSIKDIMLVIIPPMYMHSLVLIVNHVWGRQNTKIFWSENCDASLHRNTLMGVNDKKWSLKKFLFFLIVQVMSSKRSNHLTLLAGHDASHTLTDILAITFQFTISSPTWPWPPSKPQIQLSLGLKNLWFAFWLFRIKWFHNLSRSVKHFYFFYFYDRYVFHSGEWQGTLLISKNTMAIHQRGWSWTVGKHDTLLSKKTVGGQIE